ncbi:MAG: M48 family metalloprotease [Sphingomonadaceae bacterium]|nr:M48 family metalloprotease [Sphingomonadaceae bacterium]
MQKFQSMSAKVIALSSVAAMAMGLQGCETGPSAKESTSGLPATVTGISQADKQQGAKAHPELLAEFGGAVSGPQAAYVEAVGKDIAVRSGLSNARGDFTVTLLNSPANNAFAIPGGYIYVTRQLTALMNNEAELAGVLGHEVGHVAARHGAKRQKAATRNSIIGVLGTVLSGVILGDSSLGRLGQKVFSQGSQMLTLKYSRSQEVEADNLGIAYLGRAGYDPRAMSSVLESLAKQNALEARLRGTRNRVPEWASTHPDPASRVRAALSKAGAGATGTINRDAFLSRIDGLTYGDDPKQGVIDGRNFVHPDLRLAFQTPDGFYMVNGTRAVSISGQSGKAQFSGGPYDGKLDNYVRAAFSALGGNDKQKVSPKSVKRVSINGLPAAYGVARVNNGSGEVDVLVFAYEFAKDRAYHFVTIAPAGQSSVFASMFDSMRRVSATEAAQVKPRRLDVVTVKSGDTAGSIAERMAFDDARLERFLVLNGLSANAALKSGGKVKVVTY